MRGVGAELLCQRQQPRIACDSRDGEGVPRRVAGAVGVQCRDDQHAEPARPQHRDRLAGARRDRRHGMQCRSQRFDQHGGAVGHVRGDFEAAFDWRQDPRAEAPGQIVDAERGPLRAMRRQAGAAERAVVRDAARVVRGVDLDDVAAALRVGRHDLMADHLRQRERQVVAGQIGRADAALAHAQQAEAGTKLQRRDVIAIDAPARALVTVEAVTRRGEALVRAVVEGVEGDRWHRGRARQYRPWSSQPAGRFPRWERSRQVRRHGTSAPRRHRRGARQRVQPPLLRP